jgi:hypothetical protein
VDANALLFGLGERIRDEVWLMGGQRALLGAFSWGGNDGLMPVAGVMAIV